MSHANQYGPCGGDDPTREDDERDLQMISELYRGMSRREAAKKYDTSLTRIQRLWAAVNDTSEDLPSSEELA
ncbi:MAG: hypothetical protein VXW22_11745 [Pseudomonadota bacterium]|nr:hypothetical protein [Pseudomonadota bacterium]